MAALSLAFDILARDRASRTFNDVGDNADRMGRRVGSAGESGGSKLGAGLKAGALIGAAGIAGLGFALSGFVKEAAESAKIGRLTDAVIASTGGAAKISAKQVNDLAGAISNKTAVDDEAIQSGANLLLTFTKVRNETGKGNDIFNQATQAAVDMSVALGTDISGASIQLGKALNDPIKGVSALSKAGVSFTEQQKEQIKAMVASGDTLGAQKIILAEMQTQFGGAAAAAADPMERLKVVAGNLGESVGGLLLPFVERFATFIGDKAVPVVESFIGGLQGTSNYVGGAAEAVSVFGLGLRALVLAFKDGDVTSNGFVGVMERVGVAARAAFDYFQTSVLPRLREFGAFVTGTIIPGLGSMAEFVKRNSDFFIPFVGIIVALTAALRVWTIVQGVLNAVLLMNPIGLVVIAVAALAAGFIYAYKNSETFRDFVERGFAAVSAAAKFMWENVLKPTFKFLIDAWLSVAGLIVEGAAKAFGWVPGIGDKLKGAAKEFAAFRDDVNSKLDGIKDKTINVNLAVSGQAEVNQLANEKRQSRAMGDGPGAGGPMVERISKMIQGTGLSVTSTYRTPARNAAVGGSPSSYHLDRSNPAVDVVGPTGALNALYGQLRGSAGLRELLWQVPGHYDHLHVADKGGVFQGPGMVYMGAGQETFASGLAKKVSDLPAGGMGAQITMYNTISAEVDVDLIARRLEFQLSSGGF